MKRIAWAALLAVVLSGCATTPLQMSETPETRYTVPAKKVIVSNYAQVKRPGALDAVWSNQFVLMANESTDPPFVDLVAQRLETQLQAGGGERELEVVLLGADLLVKSRAADSIPFIGLFSGLAERDYMCRVEAILSYPDSKDRRIYESVGTLRTGWRGVDVAERAAFVDGCLSDIFAQIQDATTWVSR